MTSEMKSCIQDLVSYRGMAFNLSLKVSTPGVLIVVLGFLFNSVIRVPTVPGKPGILSFSFPCLENAWNLLKKW